MIRVRCGAIEAAHFTPWLARPENIQRLGQAIGLERWAIDESNPAVRFNVVSRPTELVRRATLQSSGNLMPTRRLQLEWWTAFRDALVSARALPSTQTPRPQYWYNIALGRTGYVLSATASVDDQRIGIRVYLMNRLGGDAALAQLMESRSEIERELGQPLVWNPNPEASDKVIALQREADIRVKERRCPSHDVTVAECRSAERGSGAGSRHSPLGAGSAGHADFRQS